MLTTVWSVKGGAGCTVVSVAIVVMRCAARDGRCVLVDLAGDLPAALGLSEPGGPGVTDWLAAPTARRTPSAACSSTWDRICNSCPSAGRPRGRPSGATAWSTPSVGSVWPS